MAVLVVAVGGGGRGAANHLKYKLERKFGSPDAAKTVILVLDGRDDEPQYKLGGLYQTDISSQSRELYQLTTAVAPAAGHVARRDGQFHLIERWLTPVDAQTIQNINPLPPQGFGMVRTAGRLCLFLEHQQVRQKINQAVGSLHGYKDLINTVFLVGSQSGGTGSGIFTDVGVMLRSALGPNDRLFCVLLLPPGYNSVITSPTDQQWRDARAFAGLREVLMGLCADASLPLRVDYDGQTPMQVNSSLFDGVFMLSGQGPVVDVTGKWPVDGVSACASSWIFLRCLEDTGPVDHAQLATILGTSPPTQRFVDFGSYFIYYPRRDMSLEFSWTCTLNVLDSMLRVDTADVGAQRTAALNFLNGASGLAGLCTSINLQAGTHSVPVCPPQKKGMTHDVNDILALIQAIKVKGFNPYFPGAHEKPFPRYLGKGVDLRSVRKKNTVSDIAQQCRDRQDHILGEEGSNNHNEVKGWVRNACAAAEDSFCDQLLYAVENWFHDNAGNPLNLAGCPNRLALCSLFLHYVVDYLQRLREIINTELTKQTVQQDIIQNQEDLLRKFLENKGTSKNKNDVEEYVFEHEHLYALKCWQVVMENCRGSLDNMISFANALLDQVGRRGTGDVWQGGWMEFLYNTRQDSSRELGKVKTLREAMRSADASWREVPTPGSDAELQFYKLCYAGADGRPGFDQSILSRVSFRVMRGGGGTNLEKAQKTRLEIAYPTDDSNVQMGPLDGIRELATGQRIMEAVQAMALHRAEVVLRGFGIWDALAEEYNYVWSPQRRNAGQSADQVSFAQDLVNELLTKAGTLNQVNTSAATQQLIAYPPNAPQGLAGSLRDAVITQIGARTVQSQHQWRTVDDVIACLTLIPGVSIEDWANYGSIVQGYYGYSNAYFDHNKSNRRPFNCFSQERNALLLEREAASSGITTQPTPLHPRVLLLLEDLDLFTRFSIYYAAGLIKHNDQRKCFELDTPAGGTQRLCDDWDLAGLFSILLGSGPQSNLLRQDINVKVDEFLNRPSKDVKNDLNNADIRFYAPPPGQQDSIPRDDLKKAMKAAIQIKIKDIVSRS